jgi:glycosyltransferase involved in cell wall biosynthesis
MAAVGDRSACDPPGIRWEPSESEACPMPVLEASTTGLPVVATDVGGTRELVEEGTAGFLVRPSAAAEITERVL